MKQKNLVLMVVAVGCGLVAAFLTTQMSAKPKVEMVDVLVATKELPTGTVFTKDSIEKLVTKKKLPKDGLPQQFVLDPAELVDKRLARTVRQDETFNPADLKKGSVITFLDGKGIASLPMSATNAAAGYVGPGSKVDVLATLILGNKLEAFPLLVDMHVVTVNGEQDLTKNAVFPNMSMVAFAVDQEEALLLAMAKQRGCHLELFLRHPGQIKDPSYDMNKIKKLLADERHPAILAATGTHAGDGKQGDSLPPIAPDAAPAPAPKPPEKVKVLVAKAEIAANTDVTKDLIENGFVEKELAREFAEGAIGDLTPYLHKSFKLGVAAGHPVTEAMLGTPKLKPAPQETFVPAKPEPKPEVAVAPPPAKKVEVKPAPPAPKPVRDVALHTASGTVIHRYEEVRPGEWKLKQVLTPEEAARPTAAAPVAGSDKAPEKAQPDSAKKLD